MGGRTQMTESDPLQSFRHGAKAANLADNPERCP
jgi:hypothetical protein